MQLPSNRVASAQFNDSRDESAADLQHCAKSLWAWRRIHRGIHNSPLYKAARFDQFAQQGRGGYSLMGWVGSVNV